MYIEVDYTPADLDTPLNKEGYSVLLTKSQEAVEKVLEELSGCSIEQATIFMNGEDNPFVLVLSKSKLTPEAILYLQAVCNKFLTTEETQ